MLSGVHILLSYTCLFQCDHCFLHCSPGSEGTFTFASLNDLLQQTVETGTVKHICFEGGEPFLYYPVMLEGVRRAATQGFSVECVTNGYWAQNAQDAALWLKPLAEAGLTTVNVSDDEYHTGDAPSPAQAVLDAADSLDIRANRYTIDPPCIRQQTEGEHKGQPIVGGGVRFRGRAADTLTQGLPRRPWREFTSCPDEDLRNPSRVHVDSLGNVHLCQGVVIGNVWKKPLATIMDDYDPDAHPICGPLLRGGPAELAEQHAFAPKADYVDACHLCYRTRQHLAGSFPSCLAPPQAYGDD